MLLATTLLWALNFTVSKYILEHGLRPLAYSGVRYSAAALVFVATLGVAWHAVTRHRQLGYLGGLADR